MIRACLSGDDSCTGIAPCDACEEAIYTRVLPRAMMAGGFNGSKEIAGAFFSAFKEASAELLEAVPHEMAAAMAVRANEEPAQPVESQEPYGNQPETETEEPKEEVNPELTEDDLSAMGRIEDFVEEEAAENKPRRVKKNKAARGMARMALKLKAKRAGKKRNEEKEGHHG